MLTVILNILFIIVFIIICLLFQISVGKSKQKRRKLTNQEAKIDNRNLWIGFYFYLFLGIIILIVR